MLRPASSVDRGAQPSGSARGRFSRMPPPVTWAAACSRPSRASATTSGRVDRARLEQLVRERAIEPRRGVLELERRQERRPDERVPVRMEPGGGEPDQDVALRDPVRPQERGFVDRPRHRTRRGRTRPPPSRPDARRSPHRGERIPPGGTLPPRPPRSRRPSWAPPVRPRGSRGRTAARRPCTRRRRRTSPRGRSRRCPAGRSGRAISSFVPTPSVAAARSRCSSIR